MRYAIILIAVFSTACAVGPNYHRPAVQIPANFRAPEPLPSLKAESLADLKWFEVFKDDKLQDLIRTALEQNYDLRTAVANIEAARANLGVTRSNQYPNLAASGDIQFTRLSRRSEVPSPSVNVARRARRAASRPGRSSGGDGTSD